MIEIALYGRGGQGVVVASQILAQAYFLAGYEVQAFPMFGPERRGTPVQAYVRVDTKPVRKRCHVLNPKELIVLHADSQALQAFTPNLTVADIRVSLPRSWLGKDGVWVCDGMKIATECHLGSKLVLVPNTALLGAYCRATERLQKETLDAAIRGMLQKNTEANLQACRMGYHEAKKI